MRVRSRWWWAACLATIACVGLAVPTTTRADARTDYLVRLLLTSTTFRVRAQAALSLGRIGGQSEQVTNALSRALRDGHPAVRTAAATSLEQRRDTGGLVALRRYRRDRDRAVRGAIARAISTLERVARTRSAPSHRTTASNNSGSGSAPMPEPTGSARYYVGVGVPGTSVRGLDRDSLESTQDFIRRRIAALEGVRIAPDEESHEDAERVLRRQRMTGYYLDSSIVRIEDRDDGVRAVVSVIVNTYPGRDMRVILQGAATVQGGGSGPTVQRQAIEGALTGALRRLPQAFAAGDARSGG